MKLKHIGFIGLGAMGLPMAQNLLKRGFDLHIAANRSRQPIELLAAAGATEHAAIADVIAHSDALITILPTDKEMEMVLLSEEALGQLREGMVLIEMTSGSPMMMHRVADVYRGKGVGVLDAPVSGGTVGAEQGTLTVMAGGDAALLERVRPVLEAMAKQIHVVGGIGTGKAIKAINQMLAGIHMIAAAEAAALSEKLGIEAEVLKRVIGSSSGASWMLMNKLDGLLERRFDPGFKLALMKKDMQIAASEAGELKLPLAQAALSMYRDAAGENGELDFSAVGKYLLDQA